MTLRFAPAPHVLGRLLLRSATPSSGLCTARDPPEREPQSYQVLAVEFSIPALAHALTECEQETAKFRTRLVRAYNRDCQHDQKTWYWNGDTLPLVPLFQRENKFPLSAGAILEVSAWTESVIIQHE